MNKRRGTTSIKVRNKRVLKELLEAGATVTSIATAEGLEYDADTKEILKLAKMADITTREMPRKRMEDRRSGEGTEAIIGYLERPNNWTLESLVDSIYKRDDVPFFLLLNKVGFESNVGTIVRTAYGAGVNGIISQSDDDKFWSDETFHLSMGTLAMIPHVKMTIFDALKRLDKEGIRVAALDMAGTTYHKADLTGPLALALGGERDGMSDQLIERCDLRLSIPMKNNLESLNVGSTAAVIMYEKLRQEGLLL